MGAPEVEATVLASAVGSGAADGWAAWRLGDLADALGRVVTVLGAGAEVARVTVGSPWRGPGEPL